jgi:hypothetical protein
VYIVDRVLPARSVEPARRAHNAHTRTASIHPDDIVVRARPGVSGRCARCIPIGERRKSSHYYLRSDLESAWGGLVKADGSPWKSAWLNMSGSPPLLGDAPGVLRWWRAQCVELVQDNFVHD